MVASAATLYTPEILALATELAAYPWDDGLPLHGLARSRSCGSTVSLALAVGSDGLIERIGLKTQACAIGQAAAAIFAGGAVGLSLGRIAVQGDAIAAWLAGTAPMPDWPGLAAIAPAQDFPGRHGAILLGWQAAAQLLPMDAIRR